MEQAEIKHSHPQLPFLQALKQASNDLQNNSIFLTHNPQPAMETVLHLQTEADTTFFTNPNLSKLSQLLCSLKTLMQSLKRSQGYGLKSLVRRQIINYRIHQAALQIQAEVQACIDRECVQNLVRISQEQEMGSEEENLKILNEFEKRLEQDFDSDFQELVLKAKGFSILESFVCDATCSSRIREHAAFCVVGLIRFNRDVFVGLVLMGPIVQSLISVASSWSIKVLHLLIRLIKSPLIDEIELDGEIPRIISLFRSEDLSIQVATMDCICEIAYYGRKEVIEGMIEQGLIEKLMELQRSINGDKLLKRDQCNEMGAKMGYEEREIAKNRPFESCVARFAVQVDIGDGLNRKEREEFKREILRRVRDASVSEAEAASIVAEVLWGSSP